MQIIQSGFICAHAVEPEGLVVRDLHLVAARDVLGGVHERLVEAHDVLARGEGGVGKALGEIGKVGVEAHADVAFFLHGFVQSVHLQHHNFLLQMRLSRYVKRPALMVASTRPVSSIPPYGVLWLFPAKSSGSTV